MMDPKSCDSMESLRELIDAHDRAIVEMLEFRSACIDRAVELKQEVEWPARIEGRIEEVLENVRSAAEDKGLDPELVDRIWRILIEWSIEREERILGRVTESDRECGDH
ncbi:chorismate mutase [Amaricoccus macauensis]|uniref:chorismate mutase n=1 Tax=Amaricoccus macauensis TaxID=57001 RepID=UPI003C7E6693